MVDLDRERYAALYGPTVGDQVRLGDTDLWVQVEEDRTIGGDEAVFGGGKSIRESMLQSPRTRADGALDTVITNVVVLDHWGVVKTDVGIRDGRIVALGRAGNPDIADGVHPDLVIGASTDVISGEGRILTAGGVDSHVHILSASQIVEAISTGITTIGGGGTGPSEGSKATTVSPGRGTWPACYAASMRCRSTCSSWARATPSARTRCASRPSPARPPTSCTRTGAHAGGHRLGAAVGRGDGRAGHAPLRQPQRGGLPGVDAAAIDGRSIHAFHAEGAGGGHAPDIMKVCGQPHIIPGSTNPTLPHTVNTVAEHLDMLIVCHHLNPTVPEDLAFAESRIRETTIAAEDVLHDMGAISITSSDAQAMGRIGEVITRTWQVAHVMKARRGPLGETLPADNERARRYVAKYTINPAVAHGLDDEIGSVEPGKLADLVLWDARFFGVRPDIVIKGGAIVCGALGDPNASIPTPQPVLMRPTLFEGRGADHSVTFVAPAAIDDGLGDRLGLQRRLLPVKPTRDVGKAQMVNNDVCPDIEIDPETFRIEVDGELVLPSPADRLPLAQLYSMF